MYFVYVLVDRGEARFAIKHHGSDRYVGRKSVPRYRGYHFRPIPCVHFRELTPDLLFSRNGIWERPELEEINLLKILRALSVIF